MQKPLATQACIVPRCTQMSPAFIVTVRPSSRCHRQPLLLEPLPREVGGRRGQNAGEGRRALAHNRPNGPSRRQVSTAAQAAKIIRAGARATRDTRRAFGNPALSCGYEKFESISPRGESTNFRFLLMRACSNRPICRSIDSRTRRMRLGQNANNRARAGSSSPNTGT